MWILLVNVIFFLVETVYCGGTVEVRLISYNFQANGNRSGVVCCDILKNSSCDGCDPYIEIALATKNNSWVAVSNTGVTARYNNTNYLDFENSSTTQDSTFNITFDRFQSDYYLVFRVMNWNISATTNGTAAPLSLIEQITFRVGQGEPSDFNSHQNYTVKTLSGTKAVIDFGYIIQCDFYYYGMCDVYCRPVLGQYTCDHSGHRVCAPGWTGVNCTIHTIGSSCSTTACEHGATCKASTSGTPNVTCICASGYTGQFCETTLPSGVKGTTIVNRSGATTSTSATLRSTQTNWTPMATNVSGVPMVTGVVSGLPGRTVGTTGFNFPSLAAVTLPSNQSTWPSDTTKPGANSDLTNVIVGATLGTIFLASIAAAILFVVCKKKKGKVEDPAISTKASTTVP